METRKQSRGEFIPIISGGIHTSWYNRKKLEIIPSVTNHYCNNSNDGQIDVRLQAHVKYRYTSSKGKMYLPQNLDMFDIVDFVKHGNNYTLYVERKFHIYGEIDLQSNLRDMEKIRICNTEFFPYIMETYHIPTNKREVEEFDLPF